MVLTDSLNRSGTVMGFPPAAEDNMSHDKIHVSMAKIQDSLNHTDIKEILDSDYNMSEKCQLPVNFVVTGKWVMSLNLLELYFDSSLFFFCLSSITLLNSSKQSFIIFSL